MFKEFRIFDKVLPNFCFNFFLTLIIASATTYAQDPVFTQFYSNPVYLNPAFSGSNKCPRIVSNYRDQWPGFSGNFITTAVTYDQGAHALNGGFGLIFLSDQISKTLKSNEVSFSYAYHQHVSRTFTINYGIQTTFIQKSVDVSNLTFSDMIHPRRGFVFSTQDIISADPVNIFDFSAGIIGYSDKFFIGFAAHHLTEPKLTFLQQSSSFSADAILSRRYTIHAGTEILLGNTSLYTPTKQKETISPSFIYSKQGEFQQLNLGLYYKRGIYVVGGWFRCHPDFSKFSSDSFIVTLGLEGNIIRVGYSYDVTTSQLSVYSGGSHEISLALKLYCKPKKKVLRAMSCPSF
jgi:type IX secretion system PorP/SprF family membrane protein